MPWVTLDLDGTLAEWPFGAAVMNRWKPYFSSPEAGAAVRAEYLRRMAGDHPADAYDWEAIHELARVNLNLGEVPSIGDLLADAVYPESLVYDDTRPALQAIRDTGWRVAIATNGFSRHQRPPLEAFGFKYEALLTPDLTGFVKPQAEFLRCLPGSSGDAAALANAAHVGDSLAQDVLAANRAGVTAAWVWRDMPQEVRALRPSERLTSPSAQEAIRAAYAAELERDGRMGRFYEGAPPRPDIIAKDLLEVVTELNARRAANTPARSDDVAAEDAADD